MPIDIGKHVAYWRTEATEYRKGRKFLFMVGIPAEVHLEGLIDLAAKKGLKTVALINGDEHFVGRRQRPPSS